MRSRLFLMVALLAVAGVMAAMAYTSAEVRNPAEATIVRTDVALLALSCNDEGPGYKDENCWVDNDGRLHLDFAKGLRQEGAPGADPEPQYVITSVSAQAKQETVGSKNKTTYYWYEITVRTSKGDVYKFTTDKHTKRVDYFEHRLKQLGGVQCVEYRYKVNNKWQDWKDYCLPDDAVPGEDGTPGKSEYGFQPGSTYVFDKLVKVTNNSEDTIDVSVELQGTLFESDANGLVDTVTIDKNKLGPGEFTYISFAFEVADDFADQNGVDFGRPPADSPEIPFEGTVIVKGQAVNP